MSRVKPGVAREYLTAVSIEAGIITLIEPNGQIGFYRQRGIGALGTIAQTMLIKRGLLDPRWSQAKELPRNWSIEFEDEEIMGKAQATFPVPKDIKAIIHANTGDINRKSSTSKSTIKNSPTKNTGSSQRNKK